MKMPSNLMQLRVLAFSLVLVIVPFFVGYYFWVANQTKYFNGRNLRILAALSTHVRERVNSQSSVLKNAVEKYVHDMAARRPNKNDDESNDTQLVTIAQLKEKNYKEHFQRIALDPFSNEGAANLQATSVTVVPKPGDESLVSAPRIEVKEESSKQWLYFEYAVAYPSTAPAAPRYLNVKARISLEQLVGPFVNKREMQENQGALYQDGFDVVLIAGLDDQMPILFQESSAELRMLSMNNLTTSTGAKVDLKLLGQSTNISDVRLGPVDYKLFVQPIQLPLEGSSTNPESPRWVACGLVEGVHFEQQRLAVSYNVLIAFGFLTVLVAVSWSFLKLLFIGPKDRFRKLDAYMLGVAAFMIFALLTLGAMFYYFYNATLTAGEVALEQFAGTIQRNFYGELEDALTQIDELNDKLDDETIAAAKRVNEGNLEKLAFRSSILDDGLITPDSPYPYFPTAFWVNEQGWQQIKWTVRSSLTNRVRVTDRAYVLKLRQGRHYSYETTKGKKHDFWFEPVTSTNTGARTFVISKLTDRIDSNPKWVSAIETRLLSLMQPVIPEGFGFAVIDDAGTVLFHSAPKLHLGENFFEECDNNQALQAAVLGRSKQAVTTSYFGKGHTLYVAPLKNFSWTVVVFNEKDSLRTTFSEILSLCLILFLSYVVLLCFLLLVSYLFNRYVISRNSPDGPTLIWPDKNRRALYIESILVNSVLVLFSCFAVHVMPDLWKLWLPALIVLVAIAHLVWRFKCAKNNHEPESPKWLNYRTAYILNVTLLFCLASVVPAYACFKIAYVEEMKLFIEHGQLSLAKAMMAREERLRGQSWSTYRLGWRRQVEKPVNKPTESKSPSQERNASPTPSPTPGPSQILIERRIADRRDVYDSFFFNTSQSQNDAPATYANTQQNWLLGFFKDFVPLFDHSSITRQALAEKAADNSRHSDNSSETALVLHAREPQRKDAKPSERLIESSLPSLRTALWWMLLPHVLVLVWLLLFYMIRQLFLFRIEEPEGDELTDSCVGSASPNRLLVLRPYFSGKDELLNRMGLNGANRFDIKKLSRFSSWDDVRKAKGGPIVLENFEYGLDDTDNSQQKLKLLEDLIQEKRTTIALSTVEAKGFWSANAKNGHTNIHLNGHSNGDTNGHTNGEKNVSCSTRPAQASVPSNRWTDALSWFLKEEPKDSGNAESFKDTLHESKDNLVARGDLDQQTIKSAFELIEKECSPRAYLQNVGLTIANQSSVGRASTSGLLKLILSNAKLYYSAIWDDCTGDEKLTLTRLARHGLLSPKDPDTEKLLMKGLIVRDPAIRIMNESFRLFILSMHMDDELTECEKKSKSNSNWEALKVPLTIGLLSVAAFLLLTQRDLYNSAVPFIGSLAAALPALMKLLSLFRPGSAAKADS